uniref:S-adenosylmethionine decarboxylase proenzyme n=2 Tax=Ciona savignyi TaxID=51511 RepID=H2Z5U5_CIOSA
MSKENGLVAENFFFEGVEKLMEIWFSCSSPEGPKKPANLIERSKWENILTHVRCKILDELKYDGQTAYVLSESSLFVSGERIILKTCGTTLCLQALPYIISLVKEECGFDTVADFFYSRKNFKKPDDQPHPYKTFTDETVYLDTILSESASYCLGRMNRDCWYLYTLNHPENTSLIGVKQADQTLEILMTALCEQTMDKFKLKDESGKERDAEAFTKVIGISDILPNSKINSVLFDPCGYSMNGLLDKGQYWTIHITPESEFSYVSFETNVSMKSYNDLICKVLSLFKPRTVSMTLFANHYSDVETKSWDRFSDTKLPSYRRTDRQVAQLQDYSLWYSQFKKEVNNNC